MGTDCCTDRKALAGTTARTHDSLRRPDIYVTNNRAFLFIWNAQTRTDVPAQNRPAHLTHHHDTNTRVRPRTHTCGWGAATTAE